jgi:hypothetical protein
MSEKEPQRRTLRDWPEYLTKEHLNLSPEKADLLECLIKTRPDKKGVKPKGAFEKAMHNCTKEMVSPIIGTFIILSDTEEISSRILYDCFEKDSAGLIDLFKGEGAIQAYEEVFCTLMLNSLRDEDLRCDSLKSVIRGESPSVVIHSILDNY